MVRKIGNLAVGSTEADRSDSALVKISSAAAPPRLDRLQPVILSSTSKLTAGFTECAGRTMADFAAVCCCFPCGLVNLLILAAVRLPAGLCCRIFRKFVILQRSKKKAFIGSGSSSYGSFKARWSIEHERDLMEFAGMKMLMSVEDSEPKRSPAAEVVEMEEKVWSKFHNSGFWRTPSQGEDR